MLKSTNIRKGRTYVFSIYIHLVFVTKYRKKVFTKVILKDLKLIFSNVCSKFQANLIQFDGEKDHVHLLIEYPPKIAISKIVNSLKGVSSRMIRKYHHSKIQKFLWNNSFWSLSYFARSSGSAPLAIIKQYIEKQNSP